MHRRVLVIAEAGRELLCHAPASDVVLPFQEKDALAGFGEIGRSDQSVVAGFHRDDVVVTRVSPNVTHTSAPYVRLAPPSTRIVWPFT